MIFMPTEVYFFGTLIMILLIKLIKDVREERYVSVYNVAKVMDYHDKEVTLNSSTKLKIEYDYMNHSSFGEIRTGFKLDVIVNGKIAQSIEQSLIYNDGNVKFKKPWKKDIEKILKDGYFVLKRYKKEEKKQEKMRNKMEHDKFASAYLSSKKTI